MIGLLDQVADDGRADEAGSAGDDDLLHLWPSLRSVRCILTVSHGFQQCKIFSGLHLNATIFHRGMIEYFNENLYF